MCQTEMYARYVLSFGAYSVTSESMIHACAGSMNDKSKAARSSRPNTNGVERTLEETSPPTERRHDEFDEALRTHRIFWKMIFFNLEVRSTQKKVFVVSCE